MNDEMSSDTTAPLSPKKFAHAVLRSRGRYDEMVKWYQTVLNAHPVMQTDFMTFLAYDDEHHRIAIVDWPPATPRDPNAEGLDHLSYTYGSLKDLLATYTRLKAVGIEPFCPLNHGPTTSFYYRDPDRNRVELQIDNFDDLDKCTEIMKGMQGINGVGVLVDPEDLAARLAAGASQAELVQKTPEEIGPLDPKLIEIFSAP
jgi:catechol 2,3-dioxygenase-like lactoylglutathione lyase family enzyme